jgi:hypothetical protein
MPSGTPFNRQFVLVLDDGRVVLDWGDDLFQDIYTGDFTHQLDSIISHVAQDDDLETLKKAGRLERFDRQQVYLLGLRDLPRKTIE